MRHYANYNKPTQWLEWSNKNLNLFYSNEKWGRFLKKKDDNIFVLDKEMAGENKENVKAVEHLTD